MNAKTSIDKNSKAKSTVSPSSAPSPSPKIVEDNGLPIAIGRLLDPNPQLARPNPNPSPPSKEIVPTTAFSEAAPSAVPSSVPDPSPPPKPTDLDATGTTSDNSNNNSTLEAESYDLNNDVLLKAHGALMFLAWCVFTPAGIISARYYKFTENGNKKWFCIHIYCFVAAFLSTVVSFALIYVGTGSHHFDYVENGSHVIIGIVIVALVFLQVPLGFVINHLYSATRGAVPWWDQLHHWIGGILFLAALINIPTGISLYAADLPPDISVSPWIWISYETWLILLAGALAFLEGSMRARRRNGANHGDYGDIPPLQANRNDFQSIERGMSDATLLEGDVSNQLDKDVAANEAIAEAADGFTNNKTTPTRSQIRGNHPAGSPVNLFGVGLNSQSRVLTPPGTLSRGFAHIAHDADHALVHPPPPPPQRATTAPTRLDTETRGSGVLGIRYLTRLPNENPEVMKQVMDRHSLNFVNQETVGDMVGSQRGSVIDPIMGNNEPVMEAKAGKKKSKDALMELYQGYESLMREQKGKSWAGFPSEKCQVAEAAEQDANATFAVGGSVTDSLVMGSFGGISIDVEKEKGGSTEDSLINLEESPPVDDVRGSSAGLESLLDKYGTMNSKNSKNSKNLE
ncbi:UNVERIFIED_CONTAM: DOMON domain-containing protein frrs1L [Siphonaria sp. JEL0065]|nr:DOMON domain-containing protein frrs1L [Siphonaria sp. JEL0065]